MLVFNCLQSQQKQGQWKKFKSGGTNNLQAKRAEIILNCCTQSVYNS